MTEHILRCYNCKNTEFEECEKVYDDVGVIEYKLKCKECGVCVGVWSYGSFEPTDKQYEHNLHEEIFNENI